MKKPLALIVEDDHNLTTIFSAALQAAEFDTEIVSDGNIALSRLTEIVPDVVVLDIHLPSVSGSDILDNIRNDERLKNTKVMLTTADAIMAETLNNEADLVLLKPISFHQLRDLAIRLRPPDIVLD